MHNLIKDVALVTSDMFHTEYTAPNVEQPWHSPGAVALGVFWQWWEETLRGIGIQICPMCWGTGGLCEYLCTDGMIK